jgi:hypothetical protein
MTPSTVYFCFTYSHLRLACIVYCLSPVHQLCEPGNDAIRPLRLLRVRRGKGLGADGVVRPLRALTVSSKNADCQTKEQCPPAYRAMPTRLQGAARQQVDAVRSGQYL